jgi:hypothetical protein
VPFFGPLPERGPWTAVGLTRGQFVGILALSVGLFLLAGGPLWQQVHAGHLGRIVASYAVIPPAAALALARNGRLHPLTLLAASVVLALLKLVLTAVLLVLFALAGAR